MPPRPARRQLGLFGNPVADFSLDEPAQTVRALKCQRPGRTADERSRAVFAELAMKRTRQAAELVAEAIRLARAREAHELATNPADRRFLARRLHDLDVLESR